MIEELRKDKWNNSSSCWMIFAISFLVGSQTGIFCDQKIIAEISVDVAVTNTVFLCVWNQFCLHNPSSMILLWTKYQVWESNVSTFYYLSFTQKTSWSLPTYLELHKQWEQ